MKKLLMFGLLLFGPRWAFALNNGQDSVIIPPSVVVSSAGLSGTAVTVLLSTPVARSANSAGEFLYITNVHLEMYATGTLTGGATPVTCTITNIAGNLVFKFPTAAATGTMQIVDMQFANPLRAAQASQVTLVCPATASVLWSTTLGYFQSN